MISLWTDEEKDLLYTNMSNQEIADKINRTVKAVKMKRYEETGHYVEAEKQKESDYIQKRIVPHMDETYKKARIITLCERLKVKLYG